MIAKARLEALTDGIFAVAMTLLVLDLRFPSDLHPGSSQELIGALRDLLWGPFVAYAISFFVIGLRWRNISRLGGTRAHVGKTYVVRDSLGPHPTSLNRQFRPLTGPNLHHTPSWGITDTPGWTSPRGNP
jgi:hypothetical protein